jgi:ubiquinone/menaquinone biosynthesis C-methylase UbiE
VEKNSAEIKAYWENRAASDSSAQSTTMDIWLRHIEAQFLSESIKKYRPQTVCDVGCGDGLTTIRCAKNNQATTFLGFDYSESMINNAISNARRHNLPNISFCIGDITGGVGTQGVDFVYTTRCLINLASWASQMTALSHIYEALSPGGIFVMIENFIEGQNLFNSIREDFGLPVIPVRDHNTFFTRDALFSYTSKKFNILNEVNISSSYYIVSRIIYSRICSSEGLTPDYNDIHHQLAASLPFTGEFGPVRAVTFQKKV